MNTIGYRSLITLALFLGCLLADSASAHVGRRFTVNVVDGKIEAQGINTGADDGAPALRPYTNVIHDHWKNVNGLELASSILPGFDIDRSASGILVGQSLSLELLGVSKWVDPPMMPSASLTPHFQPLDAGELVTVIGAEGSADSQSLGSTLLLDEVPFGGVIDIDPTYQINRQPVNEIHVLRMVLHATPAFGAPTVEPSDTIYVLMSPDGATMMERLHDASLFLEGYLATVPEPASAVSLVSAVCLLGSRRKRRDA